MAGEDASEVDRIGSLGIWRGSVTIRPLPGGITNRNYRVDDEFGSFVARIGADLPWLGVDRRNELACGRAAEALGVAPPIVFAEKGWLVTRYVESRVLTPESGRDPEFIPRLARLLRALHDGWDGLRGEMFYFSPFQANRTYAETSRRLGARLPEGIDALLEDDRRLSRRVRPFVPTLCHNDMLPANVLDDGRRVWIVDWEYGGIGHPFFDLAGISANCEYGEDLDRLLLTAYRGHFDPADLVELRIFKASSLLREALWSIVQTVASDLDFDYRGYAEASLERHRAARASLGGPEKTAWGLDGAGRSD